MSTTELLQENLTTVAEREPEMMSTFYGLLFERYPAARPLFGRNSQREQEKMLGEALTMLISQLDDMTFVEQTMLAVGRKHVDYGVEDHMYPWVAECLLETLKRGSGDAWTDEIATGWTGVLNTVSEIAIRGSALERADRSKASSTDA